MAADYLAVDANLETGEELSDSDIMKVVRDVDEENSSGDEADDLSVDVCSEVTTAEARKMTLSLQSYFEQRTDSDEDKERNVVLLGYLEAVHAELMHRMLRGARQTSIIQFLVKK